MENDSNFESGDRGKAQREDRPLRHARRYRIHFAQDGIDFRPLDMVDPVPLGRQILAAAGLNAQDGYSLFSILPSGDFEEVRLNEPFDLRRRGVERFLAFLTDRTFKLTLDGAQLEWGKPVISGAVLYGLAKLGNDEAVFLEVRGGQAQLIEPGDSIDLTRPEVERFITAPKIPTAFQIIVNSRRKTVPDRKVTFEQIVQLAFPGQHAANVVFSMTYRHAVSKPHSGELGKGGVVEVGQEGTVFNVTRTVQS